jgi:hypothetical protein
MRFLKSARGNINQIYRAVAYDCFVKHKARCQRRAARFICFDKVDEELSGMSAAIAFVPSCVASTPRQIFRSTHPHTLINLDSLIAGRNDEETATIHQPIPRIETGR